MQCFRSSSPPAHRRWRSVAAAALLFFCALRAWHARVPQLFAPREASMLELRRAPHAWSFDEIRLVPGVGAKLARRVHDHLSAGGTLDLRALQRIHGVGPHLAARIRALLRVPREGGRARE